MWNRKRSVKLSIAVCVVMALLIAFCVLALPYIYEWNLAGRVGLIGNSRTVIGVTLGICAVVIFFAFYQLIRLLINIKKDDIFVSANVKALRIISWCCFFVSAVIAVGAVLAFPQHIFTFALISVAACFGGLLMRVVKNVMQTAVELRKENDLTI